MKTLILFLVVSLCSATAVFAEDEATLNQAIATLNGQAKTVDKKIVLGAVAQQTNVPEKTLESQMAATHLTYGELVVANSLAQGSGQAMTNILALKKGKGWAEVSREVKINPASVIDRVRTTQKVVQMSQTKLNQTKKSDSTTSVRSPTPSPTPMAGRLPGD
jgi:predicted ATPase with chaperone activity